MKFLILLSILYSTGLIYGEVDYFGVNKEDTGLQGFLYDLKNDGKGEPSAALGGGADPEKYYNLLEELLEKELESKELEKYKAADTTCNFEYMAFKNKPAKLAPTAFGSSYIDPKAILIVYSGVIEEAPEDEFRFAGYFDDAVMVLVNGEVVFYNALHDLNKFKPEVAASEVGKHDSYGKYITLKKGDEIKIAFAEVPGGSIGGVLRVQLKKFRYKKNKKGDPILHPFVARKVDRKLEKEMESRGLTFEDRRIPEFIFTK